MKNNTGTSKHYLVRAMQTLPTDNALVEVRALMQQALSKMEHTEKKRAVRETEQKPTAQQNWNEMLKQGVAQGGLTYADNPSAPKRTIDILNQMIAEEQRKLEALARQNATVPGKRQAGDGDNELQTIHG